MGVGAIQGAIRAGRGVMKALAAITAFLLVSILSYGGWILFRYWNYSWGYESMVRNTVCEMVKPEYLKEPC